MGATEPKRAQSIVTNDLIKQHRQACNSKYGTSHTQEQFSIFFGQQNEEIKTQVPLVLQNHFYQDGMKVGRFVIERHGVACLPKS